MAAKANIKDITEELDLKPVRVMKKPVKPYVIHVTGHGLTPLSGAVPDDIENLVKKSSGNTKALQFKIVTAIVDKCIQVNDVEGALAALEKYRSDEALYAFPLNTFKRDLQNKGAIYMGAHCFYGAIRETIVESYYEEVKVYKKGKKGFVTNPSAKRIRNYVSVKPNHVFLHKPDSKDLIFNPDITSDPQQPVGDVKGFSRFEVINPPYEFSFSVHVHPRTPWVSLQNEELMKEILWYSAFRGIGSRRGAGFGSWRIDTVEFETINDLYDVSLAA